MMKQIFVIFSLLFFHFTTYAQEKFVDHISKSDGKATVNVHMPQRLADLLNCDIFDEEDKQIVEVRTVVQKTKVRGFRIQVYWGGSQQSEKSKAQTAGYKVTALFPELEAYTSFESPHWRCRVGDFKTQKEADEYLKKIKKSKIINDPIIVKSEIYMFK